MRLFANFISYLFHPLFTTFYVCVLGILYHPTIRGRVIDEFVLQIIFLLLASVVIIPLLSLIIVKHSGYISSWRIENRKERIIPFVIVAIMMGISSLKLMDNNALEFCGKISLAASIGLLINIPFLYFWNKPSAHVMAIVGGATAFLKEGMVWYSNDLIATGAILLLITGIIATSRLILKSHSLFEILLGGLIGFLVILPII